MVERLIATALLSAPLLPVLAQAGLSDPTRPPHASAMAAGAGPGDEARPSAPRLQSVLISPQRSLAVIDGRTVALGGAVGAARLVQISETQVTLQNGAETRVLELNPGIARSSPGATYVNRNK